MERIDSCHSIWLLDAEETRFARLPRGSKADTAALKDEWRRYYDHEVQDDGAHVLAINESKTRLLRFFEHSDPCPHCGLDRTEELRVEPVEEA